MKSTSLTASLLASMAGMSTGQSAAADYKKNPFTLTYEGALTRNEPGKVHIHPTSYKLKGLDISANIYTPPNYDPKNKVSVIVVAHPNGGVRMKGGDQ